MNPNSTETPKDSTETPIVSAETPKDAAQAPKGPKGWFKGINWSAALNVKVLKAVCVVLVVVMAWVGLNHIYNQLVGVRRTVTSFISKNSPIAKLATREIVWRVVVADDGPMKTSVEEIILKVLAGYDLALVKPEDISYDLAAKKVTIRLPTPIIMSIDDFMTREMFVNKESAVSRLFSREKSSAQDVLARLVVDAEKYGIFSAESIREGMDKLIGAFVKQNYRFEVSFVSDNPLSPTDMVVAYLAAKGVEIDRAAFDKKVEDVRKGKDKGKKVK